MQGLEAHPPALGLEAEDAEGGDHARDAPEEQPALAAALAAVEPARARDEIHRLREAPLLVHGEDDDLAAKRDDVVGAAAAGQPDLGPLVAAPDGARVEVAVTVDLGSPDEADVEKPPLREQEGVRDPRQHLGMIGRAHLVGRDGERAGLPLRPDDAALDHHGQARGMRALGERRSHQGSAHAGKDRHVVLELARAHDGEQLVGGDAAAPRVHDTSSFPRRSASARAVVPKRARYSAWVAGP